MKILLEGIKTYGQEGWEGTKTVTIQRTDGGSVLIYIHAPDSHRWNRARIQFTKHEAEAISRGLQSVVEGAALEETLKIPGTPPQA